MKKIVSKIFIIILAISMFALVGCSNTAVPPTAEKQPPIISAETMDKTLKEYLKVTPSSADGDAGSRAYTSDSATATAQFLFDKFDANVKVGEGETAPAVPEKVYKNVKVMPLTQTSFEHANKREAFNVVVRYSSPSKIDYNQVVIGTSYDNSFGKPTEDKAGTTTLGAIGTGTSVATLISMIDYFNQNTPDLGFDVVFCFFAGAYGSAGSVKYIDKTMTVEEKQNTLLMVNLTRIGGDNLYIYSDEVKTEHNEFLFNNGAKAGLTFNRIPKSIPIIEQQYINKVPYTHYAMLGDHAPFMERNISVANIFSGTLGGINLSNLEVKGKANLTNTVDDTYSNLTKYRPNYAMQMQDVATLLINSLSDPEFAEVMVSSKANVYDYSWATQWIWVTVGVLGLIVLLIVLVILLVKHFEKKYPFVPKVRRLKIAVFGLEYETQTEEDIFVDIKKKRDPFSGY